MFRRNHILFVVVYFMLFVSILGCSEDSEDETPDLNGQWTGFYGYFGVGDEIISIKQNGEEAVATKVTGDANVPASQITWRANVVTGNGEGQVASTGFLNPRFVPGILEIINDDTISFTWSGVSTVIFLRMDD